MPTTPTYAFAYEAPGEQPGITLTGEDASPILAEQVEDELVRLEGDISDVSDEVAANLARGDSATSGATVNVADSDGEKAMDVAVTVTIGPVGIAIVSWNLFLDPTTGTSTNIMEQWVRYSGANSGDTFALRQRAGEFSDGSLRRHGVDILTGLTPGSTTFTLFASMSTNAYDILNKRVGVVSF